MMFIVSTDGTIPAETIALRWRTSTKRKIALYPLNTTDKILENYLLKKYNISLKILALKILNNTKIMNDKGGKLITVITNKEIEKLARLITFGTGRLYGSNILKFAFKY